MTVSIRQIIEHESIEILMQLVISPNRDFTAGIEALSRGIDFTDGSLIQPLVLFEEAQKEGVLVDLEKLLIAKALKAFKPVQQEQRDLLLFINLSDDFLTYALESTFLTDMAEACEIQFNNIVFDINPRAENALDTARCFVEKYRPLGFYVCIDDIGTDYHNIDKILYLSPDMIKVNVAAIKKISHTTYRRGMIKYIKYIADQQGILLVAKGIENESDVQHTLRDGAQFMQGYFISEPVNLEKVPLKEIIDRYREVIKPHYYDTSETFETTRTITSKIISITREIRSVMGDRQIDLFEQKAESFFELYPFIENLWFLDGTGHQLGDTFINTKQYPVKSSPMFQIYNEGSDFSTKEIYQQLTDTILDVWVTKPYRSILTNNAVIGCSMYAIEDAKDSIICANFNYSAMLEYLSSKQ